MSKVTEETIKTILAWASISYGFGFFTVLLHTARLNLPVIELLQPVYIIVGIPLALFAFFSNQILSFFNKRILFVKEEYQVSFNQLTGKFNQQDINAASGVLAIIYYLPFGSYLARWIKPSLDKWFESTVKDSTEINESINENSKRKLNIFLGISRFLLNTYKLLNIINYIGLIFLILFVYVWIVYPLIPQSLGGGKSIDVRLVVERNTIPSPLINIESVSKITDQEVILLNATLLYSTKEFFHLELKNQNRLSIKSDAVKMIIWNKNLKSIPIVISDPISSSTNL